MSPPAVDLRPAPVPAGGVPVDGRPHRRRRRSPGITRQQERRALLAVFLIALFLRVLFLERLPDSVTADELDFASNALEVVSGQGPGLFGLDWTPEPALGLHFIVGSWQLFGMTLFAERLVAAVLTALAVLPFYALLRRLVPAEAALPAALLFACARWLLLFGRSGWNNGDMVLFMLLGAWALTLALERPGRRAWLAFGACLALLLYGYFAGRAVVLAFALYLAGVLARQALAGDGEQLRRTAAGAALAALTCIVLFLPEVPTIAAHWQAFNQRTAAVFILNQPLDPGETRAELLGRQAWTAARSFLFMDPTAGASAGGRTARYRAPGQSWLDPASAALYLAGMAVALARRRTGMALWWCLLLIPLAATQVLSSDTPDGARGLAAVAPMYVFVAVTLDALLRAARGRVAWLPGALLAAAALVGLYNVASYARWVQSPEAVQARQPGVPVSGFYTWRDFQLARLRAHQGIMPAGEYDQLSPAAIAAQLAGLPDLAAAGTSKPGAGAGQPAAPALPSAPPANPAPQQNMAHQVATVGAAGDAPGGLVEPRDVAADAQGDLYVADTGRRAVVKFGPDGRYLLEWTLPGADQPSIPWAVATAPDGTVFVLDAPTGRVARYSAAGAYQGPVALTNPVGSSRGMTPGLDGAIAVAQTPANRVARFSLAGAPLPDLGQGVGGKLFDQPTSAVAEADGSAFVYQPDSGRLDLHAPDGRLLLTLKAPRVDTVGAGRLAIAPDGRVLLADAAGRQVLVYGPDARLLGSFPVDGRPQGLAVTPAGTVAVADIQGKLVRVYAFAG